MTNCTQGTAQTILPQTCSPFPLCPSSQYQAIYMTDPARSGTSGRPPQAGHENIGQPRQGHGTAGHGRGEGSFLPDRYLCMPAQGIPLGG